jgi:hypothetical protein
MKSPAHAFPTCTHALSTHGHPTTRESVGLAGTRLSISRSWRSNVVRCCWSSQGRLRRGPMRGRCGGRQTQCLPVLVSGVVDVELLGSGHRARRVKILRGVVSRAEATPQGAASVFLLSHSRTPTPPVSACSMKTPPAGWSARRHLCSVDIFGSLVRRSNASVVLIGNRHARTFG